MKQTPAAAGLSPLPNGTASANPPPSSTGHQARPRPATPSPRPSKTSQWRPTSLRFQLMGWFLAATLPLVALAVLGLAIYAARQDEAQGKAHLASGGIDFSTAVSVWFEHLETDARYVASQPDIVSMDPQRQIPALRLLVQTHPWIRYAHTSTPAGVNSARSDDLGPIDYHDRFWFQNALAGTLTHQTLAKTRTTGQPALTTAAPIRNSAGHVVGVLAIGVDLETLTTQAGAVQFGDSGYRLLVDEHGLVLARPGLSATSSVEDLSAFPPVRRLLAEHSTSFLDFTDQHRQRWLSFAQPTINGWGVIAIQKRNEVLAPMYRTLRFGVGAFLLLGLVANTVIWLVSGTLVRPIRQLTNAAQQVAAGNWRQRVPVGPSLELATLGHAFNDMVDNLEQSSRHVQTTMAQLRESEERFRFLVEGVNDHALFMLDPQGRVASWNTGAQHIQGYTAHEIVGHDFSCFFPPEDIAAGKPQHELKLCATQGQYTEEGWRIRKDGSRFWAAVTTTAVHDDTGTLRGFAKLTADMTERKQAQEAQQAATVSAQRAKAAAEIASKAKDHFLAVLSHELRTPLNPVLVTAALLRKDPRFDADTREQLEVICRNTELEARLIDDLLDVTRIERGKVELDRRPIDLRTIIRRAIEVCQPDIQARKLHFCIDLGSSACCVDADAARLQQVFWNLLKNALKFTPPNGRVTIRCRKESAELKVPSAKSPSQHSALRAQNFVVAEVTDNGVGMDSPALQYIFNAFEQGERTITRQFGGLGLGLAICKALVELHGGTISARSPGKNLGSTFTVRLPLLHATAPAPAPPPTAPAPPTTPSQPLRILLVEDHADTARVMRRLLAADGHQVQIAPDIATALDLAQHQPFDLLLSDLGLPDGSGLDLLHALRALGRPLPAIAISGYDQETDIQRSHDAGFLAHLAKPVSLPKLEEAMRHAMVHQ